MTDRGKTIICSVLFLDIAEYSRKSVSGQISLKERFNAYLSVAIRDVPIDDRIILDTGDGAALSFLGDVGDALQVALSMRESLREGLHMEPPLLVRMGINLGPVRLIRDINGQPNIVGDGINVAQRVMGFADPGQILVSRTYYDAVSRLSPEYAGMFHYQGSRTDKHVREHEIYAIGYPGEFTSTLTLSGEGGRLKGERSGALGKSWRNVMSAFRAASLPIKFAYIAAAMLPIAALVVLLATLVRRPVPPPAQPDTVASAVTAMPVIPASTVIAPVSMVAPAPPAHPASAVPPAPPVAPTRKTPPRHTAKDAHPRHAPPRTQQVERAPDRPPATTSSGAPNSQQATLVLGCPEGSSVYVDGRSKGTVGKSSLTVQLDPGKHLVLVMLSSRMLYTKSIEFGAGKAVRVSRDLCH
jgi:hypothetical protein